MNTPPPTPSPKKILVVDDNEIIVKTVCLKLQAAGYAVNTAADGAEAVAAARQDRPDLIVLDISFPPEVGGVPWDGFRLMEWFHRLDPVRKIPVVIITGTDDPKVRQRATESGAIAFLQKPLDHAELVKIVRSTLA